MNENLILKIVLANLFFFPFIWSFVCFILSRIGGWASLVRHFKRPQTLPEVRQGWRALAVRRHKFLPCSYRGCINLGVDEDALYIWVMKIFRIGHAPLRIPFSDIHIERNAGVFSWHAELSFPQHSSVTILMSMEDVEWVESAHERFLNNA